MTNVNYALLAALVDEQDANLFDEIFAHIIGYSISVLAESHEKSLYYKTDALQEKIKEEVGIEFPTSVIRMVLEAKSLEKGDVEIEFCGDCGHNFKITRAWNASKQTRVAQKTQALSRRKGELEALFDSYLQKLGVTSELHIIDFLHSNTEEALAYLKGEDSHIDERYVHVVKFFEYIRANNSEMYEVICDISWAAVVAGLLEGVDKIKQGRSVKKVEYFLDTPIVMAALDLSRESNVAQARDLLHVIDSNNAIAKVHPLTLREIDSILFTVSQNGRPYGNNELAEAYERRNLRRSDITLLKGRLKESLQELGIVVLELADHQVDRMISEADKKLINKLAKKRCSDRENSFREQHDICVWKYVARHNRQILSNEIKVYFVTSNSDLIRFTEENRGEDEKKCLIRSDNVVLNLWLHGCFKMEMKKELLSEKISKCFVANEVDTIRRMDAVINSYKSTTPVTDEEASILLEAIAERNSVLIGYTDRIQKGDDSIPKVSLVTQVNESNRKKREREVELQREMNEKNKAKEEEQLKREALLEEKVRVKDGELQEKSKAYEHLRKENELRQSLAEKLEEISTCQKKLVPLKTQRSEAVRMWVYYVHLFLLVSSIFLFCIMFVWGLFKGDLLVAIVSGGFGLLFGFISWISDRKKFEALCEGPKGYRGRKIREWEEGNPDYKLLTSELEGLEKDHSNLQRKLDALLITRKL